MTMKPEENMQNTQQIHHTGFSMHSELSTTQDTRLSKNGEELVSNVRNDELP